MLQWLLAGLLLVAIPVAVRIVDALLRRRAASAGDSTPGPWFARLASAVREPAAALIRIAGVWIVVHEVLTLPAWLSLWAERGVYCAFIIGLGWLCARQAEAAVDGYLVSAARRKGEQVDSLLGPLLRGASSFLVWLLVVIIGLDNAGYEIGAIIGGLGIGGLAVALAAKDIVADILGGAIIMLNRPFVVGDKIMFKGEWATVLEFGLRTTTLRDFKWNFKYIVRNAHFTSNEVVNISDHPGCMILMNIRLSLTTDAEQLPLALSLIQDILKGHPEVRYIWSKLDHFDEYAFTLRIHYDILEFKHRIRVKSEVNIAIARAFQAHGIQHAAMPVRTIAAAPEACPWVG